VNYLGLTRSARALDHLLQTPDTFVRASLPGMRNATAIVHIAPALGARFTCYTAEFEPGGSLPTAEDQRFVYVLDGALLAGAKRLTVGGYAYVPPGPPVGNVGDVGDVTPISAVGVARAVVFEKPYVALAGTKPPKAFMGHDAENPVTLLNDDPGLEVRQLVPDDPAWDFRVNTMTYQPGAALPAVEIHVMEHGLLMLDGGGVYRLGASWYPVGAGDVIWMAPYCPQWFGAIGKTPARYLIYKDWDRHPR